MELLEGESLADRIHRGALPLGDVIRYGAQIAEALDRAHREGIVHRDLKPGNVMITKGGAKLLDFGLAKSAAIEVNPDGATQQKPLTQEGTILGTFQYMAPEQLEGLEADARSDIFALGAVLYEMITGRRAFDGKTKTSLIAAIVAAQPPPISVAQPLAPSALEHIVNKCLEKNADERWQSAHDVAQELRWAGNETTVASRVRPQRWVWSLVTLFALGTIVFGALYLQARLRPSPRIAFSIPPPVGFTVTGAVISPDGRSVALQLSKPGESSIWIRRLEAVDPVRLTAKGQLSNPIPLCWSPDGKSLLLVDPSGLIKLSIAGGKPELVAPRAGYGDGAAWSRSGTILYSPRFGEGLSRVPASGGELTKVTTLDAARHETLHGYPHFLADDDHFLYLVRTTGEVKSEIFAGSLSKPLKKQLVKADSLVGAWKDRLLFVRDGAMYAQEFDQKALEVRGEPRKILDDVFYYEDVASSGASVSAAGEILYVPAAQVRMQLQWTDRNGRPAEKLAELTDVGPMSLSPDESKIAMLRFDAKKGAFDVYTFDVARGLETKITGGLANHRSVHWSPDGQQLFFSADRAGMYDLFAEIEDGTAPARELWSGGDDKHVTDVSSDGKYVLANYYSPATRNDVWLVPTNGREKPRPLIVTDGTDAFAHFSPDGKSILYTSNRSGRDEVFVRSFPDGRSVQVSTGGGADAQWSGKSEIIFMAPDRTLMAAPVQMTGSAVEVAKPTPLFQLPDTVVSWTTSRRSDRFLTASIIDPQENIRVVNYVSSWDER